MHCTALQVRPGVVKRPEKGVTILVVEDECFVRDVSCEILRGAGYRVLGAESAVAARRVFLRYGKRIQLMLCDAVLPDTSGVVLSETLRRLSPGLKVILASGYPRTALLEDLDREARDGFLAKPYGAASLVSKVQMALQEGPPRPATQTRGR
jgi:DNA-binding NtrC family response regulator